MMKSSNVHDLPQALPLLLRKQEDVTDILTIECLPKASLSCRLRRLSESLILIWSTMFGATFNLVTRVGLP